MIRAIVMPAAVMVAVVSAVVVMVNLAVGVLLMLPRRVVGTVSCLSDTPTAKGQGASNSNKSGYAYGSLDHLLLLSRLLTQDAG